MKVVKDPPWLRALIWIGFPLIGAGVGWLLKLIAGWVASLRWAPFQGPFKLVASLAEPGATIGALVVGVLGGFVVSFLAWQDSLTVTVDGQSVKLKRGDKEREIAASAVSGVFADGKELVLLSPDGHELARERSDLEASALGAAFGEHGYRWLEADPYEDLFRKYVEADPRLPAAANALLKARARAVEKGKAEQATELRTELADLGVVVRERGKRQFWRLAQ